MPIDAVNPKDVIKLMLDLSLRRAEVASVNIAGASTPGFLAQRVDGEAFRAQLFDALSPSGAIPLNAVKAQVTAGREIARPDQEIAELVAASSDYQALLETLNRHMSLMRLAITSRGQA